MKVKKTLVLILVVAVLVTQPTINSQAAESSAVQISSSNSQMDEEEIARLKDHVESLEKTISDLTALLNKLSEIVGKLQGKSAADVIASIETEQKDVNQTNDETEQKDEKVEDADTVEKEEEQETEIEEEEDLLQDLPEIGTSLNDLSFDEISRICKANKANDYFQVGDAKQTTLAQITNNTPHTSVPTTHMAGPQIIDLILVDISESGDRITLWVSDYESETIYDAMMNISPNSGGWGKSCVREFLNSEYYSCLPQDLQNVIADHNTFYLPMSDSTEAANCTDKLYLLSAKEVYGENTLESSVVADRETQLTYFKNKGISTGNKSNVSLVRGNKKNMTKITRWLLRSMQEGNSFNFCIVSNVGTLDKKSSGVTGGVNPAFDIQ